MAINVKIMATTLHIIPIDSVDTHIVKIFGKHEKTISPEEIKRLIFMYSNKHEFLKKIETNSEKDIARAAVYFGLIIGQICLEQNIDILTIKKYDEAANLIRKFSGLRNIKENWLQPKPERIKFIKEAGTAAESQFKNMWDLHWSIIEETSSLGDLTAKVDEAFTWFRLIELLNNVGGFSTQSLFFSSKKDFVKKSATWNKEKTFHMLLLSIWRDEKIKAYSLEEVRSFAILLQKDFVTWKNSMEHIFMNKFVGNQELARNIWNSIYMQDIIKKLGEPSMQTTLALAQKFSLIQKDTGTLSRGLDMSKRIVSILSKEKLKQDRPSEKQKDMIDAQELFNQRIAIGLHPISLVRGIEMMPIIINWLDQRNLKRLFVLSSPTFQNQIQCFIGEQGRIQKSLEAKVSFRELAEMLWSKKEIPSYLTDLFPDQRSVWEVFNKDKIWGAKFSAAKLLEIFQSTLMSSVLMDIDEAMSRSQECFTQKISLGILPIQYWLSLVFSGKKIPNHIMEELKKEPWFQYVNEKIYLSSLSQTILHRVDIKNNHNVTYPNGYTLHTII